MKITPIKLLSTISFTNNNHTMQIPTDLKTQATVFGDNKQTDKSQQGLKLNTVA